MFRQEFRLGVLRGAERTLPPWLKVPRKRPQQRWNVYKLIQLAHPMAAPSMSNIEPPGRLNYGIGMSTRTRTMGLQELKAAPQRIEYALVIGVVVRYLDDNKMTTFTLSRERHDPINGILSVASPLGSRLIGRVEEDETEVEADGRSRPVLIVRTDRPAATMH
jgi:hypothetical protein